MPIIHNESFDESDPFQLRRHGFYDMEGGPPVITTDAAEQPVYFCQDSATEPGEPEIIVPASEPSLARFVAYWTPERIRAARMAEHRRDG